MSNSLAQRAATLLAKITPDTPADAVLRAELRARPDLDTSEKRALSEAVFAYYRWLGWLDDDRPLPARVLAALELQKRHDAEPRTIKPEALLARALPAWAIAAIDFPSDEDRLACLRQFQRPPVLWIRPQHEFARSVLRALRHATPAQLKPDTLPDTTPEALASLLAARYDGPSDLHKTDEFKKGLFEIQDLASQIVGLACAPRPGETWWDACCGQGGKTLHLADLMHNQGLIWATDRHTGRLATLRKRAARAHVFNYRSATWNGGPFPPTKTRFDGILVDAPCSGLGTWQRNPHARWTTTEQDVRELADLQLQLLENTWRNLKPGGRLIYTVCTLTRTETTDIARTFTVAHPKLEPIPVLGAPAHTATSGRFLWPHHLDANGMFIAAWRRKPE